MSGSPVFLTPTTPTGLLTPIIHHASYPTTLLIGCHRAAFQDALLQTALSELHAGHNPKQSLVTASLQQTAVAKHIRTLFVPSVAHLRGYLSVFTPCNSKTAAPPAGFDATTSPAPTPLLILYGFLDLHRESSEWNAQGLGLTAALLVETARRTGFKAVLVEPTDEEGHPSFDALLSQEVPLLGMVGGVEGTWSGRRVEIKRVLGRWFGFEDGPLETVGIRQPTCSDEEQQTHEEI
jgi:hypothetical protein